MEFSEFERGTGEVAASGRAERAILYTDSEDAVFMGSVTFDSRSEDASLEAEYLSWDAEEKRLEGGLDRVVAVRRGDGSWTRGAGFSADARRRSFAFRGSVEGVIEDAGEEAP